MEHVHTIAQEQFDNVRKKLTDYYKSQKIDFYSDKIITDRTHQWFADSILYKNYGGRIYYDSLKRTPKPRDAYKKAVLELIKANEIIISDEFLKQEILGLLENYTKKDLEIKCDFNKIETWPDSK